VCVFVCAFGLVMSCLVTTLSPLIITIFTRSLGGRTQRVAMALGYHLLCCLSLVAFLLVSVKCEADTVTSASNLVLFADISVANRNESYEKIKNINIKTYEFKYDKIPG
jgi:hypothetical protein